MFTGSKFNACLAAALIVASGACDRKAKRVETPRQAAPPPDVTLVYELASDTAILQSKFQIKGEKARNDVEEGLVSTIHDPQVGLTYLDHRSKTYAIMPLGIPDTSGLGKKSEEMAAAFEMRFTGKKEKIGQFECEEFVLFDTTGKQFPPELRAKAVAWITKGLKGGDLIQARKDKTAPSQMLKLLEKTASKKIAMPGFAVRTITFQGGQNPVTSTCVEIRYDPLDPKLFLIVKRKNVL